MHIKIEREINADKWILYPEVIDRIYLKQVVHQSIRYSKYGDFFNEVELSITFTDNQEITEVNKNWRNKDKPTNVIAIQVEDFSDIKKQGYVFLGNIMLSIDKIEEEIREGSKKFINHCTHLIIHGMLHLMGYDHYAEDETVEMESTEIEILKEFDIPPPY